jgi:hypothetical protein
VRVLSRSALDEQSHEAWLWSIGGHREGERSHAAHIGCVHNGPCVQQNPSNIHAAAGRSHVECRDVSKCDRTILHDVVRR